MKSIRLLLATMLMSVLTGCLEVEQHPGWRNGEYNGKKDNMPQQAFFYNDRLAWNAAISDRNQIQNEYRRTNP